MTSYQRSATFTLIDVDPRLYELIFGVCMGCASEEDDRYFDLADCQCHERGYN